MVYVTDGERLHEVLAEDVRRNFGLGASFIREVALRDVVTGAVRFLWGSALAALTPISPKDV